MGYFYTGFDYKNRKNGYFKIGETGMKYLNSRLSVIRQTDCFQCLKYLILPDSTKSEREVIESIVRLQLERAEHLNLTHAQNDHFLYIIRKDEKYEQAYEIADYAIEWAIKACEMFNIKYAIGTKVMKRG